MLITVIAFFVVLSVLVLIHEFGHFITAKKLGIKVEEFGFGFPPRVFGKKIGETLYSINLLPIGGFVKLYGEDSAGGAAIRYSQVASRKNEERKATSDSREATGPDLKRAFFARPIWQRFIIVFAGVVMNFFLAVVLISYLFSAKGVALPIKNVRVVEVMKDSPAAHGGLKKGDEVIEINNKKVTKTQEFANTAKKNAGKLIELRIKRGEQEFTIKLIPRESYPKGEGPLGVAITNIEIKKYPWYQAPFFGTVEAFKFSWMILSGLFQMVSDLVLRGQKPLGVAGPVGVAELTGQAVSYGFDATLWFVALLSLNLAVVNVLPIPALDGGRLFFILFEAVSRKKVSAKYESMAHAIGLAVLLVLILIITFYDVIRLLAGQPLLPKM